MTESEYNERIEDTLIAIEEVLDEAESDLDYENQGGMLTVKCENGTQVIFTRQPPLKQLWVATPTGGYHFDYNNEQQQWLLDSDKSPLAGFLTQVFADQAGENFTFSV